jgi:predicted esterase
MLFTLLLFMQTRFFSTLKTARYCTLGEHSPQTRQIWFVCHGYGQLAPYFIKNFDVLQSPEHWVIAPEALSKFYLDGFSGRIGATWMTKDERLHDINDYIHYLNSLYSRLTMGIDLNNVQVNILGFSQGAATVCRWVADKQIKFDRLILWAGVIPPDLPVELDSEVFKDKQIELVYGEQDEFVTEELIEEQTELLEESGLHFTVTTFNGKHVIDKDTLRDLAKSFL